MGKVEIGVFVSVEAGYLLSGAIGNASAGAVVLPAVNGNRVDAVPGCLGNDVAHLLLAETQDPCPGGKAPIPVEYRIHDPYSLQSVLVERAQ